MPYVRVKLAVNEPTLWSPTEKRRRTLQAAGEQVAVGRLTEGAAELAAEVGAGEARGGGHVVDVDPLRVAGVGQVLAAQHVPSGRDEGDGRPARWRAHAP
jgi:hypothetical protein